MKKDTFCVDTDKQSTAKHLTLIKSGYHARFSTSQAVHIAAPGEWRLESKKGFLVIDFSGGRVLDSQNRAWMKGLLSIRPAIIEIPHEYPMILSAIGTHPRYYIQFPRACSLTFEYPLKVVHE